MPHHRCPAERAAGHPDLAQLASRENQAGHQSLPVSWTVETHTRILAVPPQHVLLTAQGAPTLCRPLNRRQCSLSFNIYRRAAGLVQTCKQVLKASHINGWPERWAGGRVHQSGEVGSRPSMCVGRPTRALRGLLVGQMLSKARLGVWGLNLFLPSY